MTWRDVLVMVVGGALFGAGLAGSTMLSPEVVLQFLRWQDFGLALVMGGAVAVVLPAYYLVPRLLRQPLLGGRFGRHASVLDRDTVIGSALFGVGWGVCGVCPGPAIAGLGAGNWAGLVALAGVALGAYVHGWQASRSGAGLPGPAALATGED